MKAEMKKLLTSSCAAVVLFAASLASAQTAPAAAGEAAQPANRPADYVVGAADVLKVTVYDEPTMSGTYRVDTDGSFQYPMLGRIAAAGMRVRDIEQMLKMKLEDGFIRRARVTVDVEQFRSRSGFIG